MEGSHSVCVFVWCFSLLLFDQSPPVQPVRRTQDEGIERQSAVSKGVSNVRFRVQEGEVQNE